MVTIQILNIRLELTKHKKEGADIDAIMKIVKENFGIDMKANKTLTNRDNASRCYVYNKAFRYFLQWAGLDYVKASTKVIPWSILKSPASCVATFLSGLYNSDGGVHLTTVSPVLAEQVQQLLLNFGIIVNKSILREATGNWHTAWRLFISGTYRNMFCELINFRPEEKNKKLQKLLDNTTMSRQSAFEVPNSQELMKTSRTELQAHHNVSRGGRDDKIGSQLSCIINNKSTLQPVHIKMLCEKYPNIAKYGPTGKYINELYTNDIFFDTVEIIEEGECQMYDLYMEDDSHSFISNGLISHNSQGSEWPYVIFYLPSRSQNKTFVNRNMIYTAITRAKRAVSIVYSHQLKK